MPQMSSSSCTLNVGESNGNGPATSMSPTAAAAVAAATAAAVTAAAVAARAGVSAAASVSSDVSPPSSWGKRKRCSTNSEDVNDLLPQPTAAKHVRHHNHSGGGIIATPQQHQQHQPHSTPSPQSQPASSSSTSVGSTAAAAVTASSERRAPSVYIRLAAESPHRSDEDSADSMYGGLHAVETDVCRDTSDTESYSTEEFATLDVLEYEIPSDSSSNEELYSHDSSSGTDDFVVTAAQLAHAIFASQQSSANVGVGDTSSSDSGATSPVGERPVFPNASAIAVVATAAVAAEAAADASADCSTDFELFADTEGDSEGLTDPELGLADYWMCVKCKNRQNNPMYRYCERCYQIRKTHFPPRPKVQKTRNNGAAARSSQRSVGSAAAAPSADCSSDEEAEASGGGAHPRRSRTRNHQRSQRRQQQRHSSAARSQQGRSAGPHSVADDTDAVSTDVDMFGGCGGVGGDASTVPNTQSSSAAPSRTTSDLAATVVVADDAATTVTPPMHLPLIAVGTTHDSGCPSSSDLTPDMAPAGRLDAVAGDAAAATAASAAMAASSQETYCSDVDEPKIALNSQSSDCVVSALVASGSSTSTLSNGSSTSAAVQQGLERLEMTAGRSLSSCSTQVDTQDDEDEYNIDDPTASVMPVASTSSARQQMDAAAAVAEADAGPNGLCMMCLTNPKNGVFVHSRFLHLCCCYRCAVKVWNKQKRCPICNCKVKNVMKLFVH